LYFVLENRLMKYYFLILSFFFIACQKEDGSDVPSSVPAQTTLNVAFAATDPLQKMDIYLPANRSTTNTKVIILIHGGAWSTGDKADFTEYVDTLKKRLPGYAIFNINYRLSTGTANLFPTQ
jgi:acetyl esterase/lipase